MSTPTGRHERQNQHAKTPASVVAAVTAAAALAITAALKDVGVDALTAAMPWAQTIATAAVITTTVAQRVATSRRHTAPASTPRTLEHAQRVHDSDDEDAPGRQDATGRTPAVTTRHSTAPSTPNGADCGIQVAGRDIHNGETHVAGQFHG